MDQKTELQNKIVTAFCDECLWVRSIRTHFEVLFESGEKRHELLAEVAKTFFSDLNLILIDYLLLQQCKLTDPALSGKDKVNLTSNYILTLNWSHEIKILLNEANDHLMCYRRKIIDARRKVLAHIDLKTRLNLVDLGAFTEAEENSFWCELQNFVNTAHNEVIGGPFEINAAMPDGDAVSLVRGLINAVDYNDMVNQEPDFFIKRFQQQRYRNT